MVASTVPKPVPFAVTATPQIRHGTQEKTGRSRPGTGIPNGRPGWMDGRDHLAGGVLTIGLSEN